MEKIHASWRFRGRVLVNKWSLFPSALLLSKLNQQYPSMKIQEFNRRPRFRWLVYTDCNDGSVIYKYNVKFSQKCGYNCCPQELVLKQLRLEPAIFPPRPTPKTNYNLLWDLCVIFPRNTWTELLECFVLGWQRKTRLWLYRAAT